MNMGLEYQANCNFRGGEFDQESSLLPIIPRALPWQVASLGGVFWATSEALKGNWRKSLIGFVGVGATIFAAQKANESEKQAQDRLANKIKQLPKPRSLRTPYSLPKGSERVVLESVEKMLRDFRED